MLFSSLVFLWYFLPSVFLLYYISPSIRIRNGILLCASIIFYAWGEPKYVFLMLCSIEINYGFGRLIAAEKENGRKRAAFLSLSTCVLVNLSLLGYFKYFNFAADMVNAVLGCLAGGRWSISAREIALPIGISFYTFQALSYVVDVYRGTIQVQKNFFRLALYISFFPQLIAGPIVKYHDVCEQISCRTSSAQRMAYGIKRFSYGLGKKMLLANTFAMAVDEILEQPLSELGTVTVWGMAILYTMQIYFDFSGYSDMAIGLGQMFGFDFMENFRYPYLSSSIREFWRRWHISLSTWFREYLYIPLGGNRKGQFRTCINLLIVFFATGLWHGAGANFIFWGLYHGLFLILERGAWGRFLEKNRWKAFNHLYVMLVVVVGWVFFRAETFGDALLLLQKMFLPSGGFYPLRMFANRQIFFFAGCGLLLSGLLQKAVPEMEAWLYEKEKIKIVDILIMAGLLLICMMYLVNNTYNPFIYFRF